MSVDKDDEFEALLIPEGEEPSEELALARELERELHLDSFLEQTGELRRATEQALEELVAMPARESGEVSEESEQEEPELLVRFRSELRSLQETLEAKLELLSSFVRDGVDVLDGRLTLTTRLLSERHDDQTLAALQITKELADLREQVGLLDGAIESLGNRSTAQQDAMFHHEQAQRLDELSHQLLTAVDSSAVGMTRRQQDLETRMARLEAAIVRQQRKPKNLYDHPFFGVVILLFLVNAFMILWLRFWQ